MLLGSSYIFLSFLGLAGLVLFFVVCIHLSRSILRFFVLRFCSRFVRIFFFVISFFCGVAGVTAGLSGAESATDLDEAHVGRNRAAARSVQRPGRPHQARDSGLLPPRRSPDGPGEESG